MNSRGVILDSQTGKPVSNSAPAKIIKPLTNEDRIAIADEAMRSIGYGHAPMLDEVEELICLRRGLDPESDPVYASEYDKEILGKLPKRIRRQLKEAKKKPRLKAAFGIAGLVNPTDVMVADQTPITGASEALLYPYHFGAINPSFWQIGQAVKLTVIGKITSAASTPGNWTTTVRWGQTTAGTSLAASAALALATTQTNITFIIELYIVCRATGSGSAGSLIVIGTVNGGTGVTLFTTGPQAAIPASAPAAVAVDTSIYNALLVDSTLGSASDSQTAQIVLPMGMNL